MQATQHALDNSEKLMQAGFVVHVGGPFLRLFNLDGVFKLTLGMVAKHAPKKSPRAAPFVFALHHTNHSWVSTDLLLFQPKFLTNYWRRLPVDDEISQLVSCMRSY
jgi:hypothetical protein